MQKPFFSIIVVSLNPGTELKKTLDSIRQQEFTDYEVILKDGGSKDKSLTALEEVGYFEEFTQCKVIVKQDKSIYDAMNQAVEAVNGQYVQFLNCGDYFAEASTLAKTAEFIENNGGAGIYYGNQYHRQLNTVVYSAPEINDFACYRNVPCHQLCFYRAELFCERGYDTRYKVRADYEHFMYCIYEKKVRAKAMPHVIASYEGGGFSETKESRKQSAREHKQITRQYLGIKKSLKYRMFLLLTLQPLRTWIAEEPRLSKGYNRLKAWVYAGKGRGK